MKADEIVKEALRKTTVEHQVASIILSFHKMFEKLETCRDDYELLENLLVLKNRYKSVVALMPQLELRVDGFENMLEGVTSKEIRTAFEAHAVRRNRCKEPQRGTVRIIV